MARGNRIIVSSEPRGKFREGIVASGQTIYPGSVVQNVATTALVAGRHTVTAYDADADGGRPKGGPFMVVIEDYLQGKLATTAYTAGERIFMYIPGAGDEMNLLIQNLSGTADDHAAGEVLIVDDTTGKFIATTGSPETEVAVLKEAITDPTADTLAWCEWTGY
jgi:hypothetical protein